jgi:hypothetical protein
MKKVIGLIAAIGLIAGIASAQVVMSKAQDKSVALRVKNGDTTTLTVVVTGAGTNFAVTVGGQAQTVDGNAATGDTATELAGLLAACTNTSAKKTLTVDANCSLAADVTKAKMLDGTYTAAAGKWLELLWDTSAHLSYDIYLPGGEYGSGSYKISKITGCPVGTGNVTLGIYQGGTLVGQQVYTSPVYVNPATWIDEGTNGHTNTYGVVAVVNVDWVVDMRNLGGQAVLIRAARATTADAGIISAVIE